MDARPSLRVMTSFAHKARSGISWNLLGAIVTNGLRIVVITILGRALEASEFGVVAAAVSVNALLFGFRDFGVNQALVQRKDLTRGHIATAFALSIYLGASLAVLLVMCAPLIARAFAIPEMRNVTLALAPLFVIGGLPSTSRMLVQRELQFRAAAIIDAASFAAGALTSIIAALGGGGVWSMVLGYLVEESTGAICYLSYRSPVISLRIERDRLRELMTFGAGQTVSYVIGMAATYLDNVIVGRFLGARVLGFYSRAYELIRFPSTVFASVVGGVLFATVDRK